MTKRPHALQDLSWPEFKARLADEPVIILPLGSQEQQGPFAPMGDYVLAEMIALAAAERAGAIAAPVLPFGYAEFFRGFAGGVQLRAGTFMAVLEDMITSFLDHGLTRIILCNGHSTNAPLIADVAHRIRQRTGVCVPAVHLWRVLPDATWTAAHGDKAAAARGHGADPVTSVAMHLTPHLVSAARDGRAERQALFGLPTTSGFSGMMFKGAEIAMPFDATEVAANGIGGGDASLSSAEAGAIFTAALVDYLADFAIYFRGCDPRAPARPQ
ncbi:creatininase family protein [Polymorphobacter sp.]|uniref:creatininase family protein n=1 Tax=Polymorphobacter sp. TaxID=1909290 RepID=UPI003F713515